MLWWTEKGYTEQETLPRETLHCLDAMHKELNNGMQRRRPVLWGEGS